MKLWVDDKRPPPGGWPPTGWTEWLWQRTAGAAKCTLMLHDIDEISLDYDMGETEFHFAKRPILFSEPTGLDLLKWMVQNNKWPARIRLHSTNLVGRKKMEDFIEWANLIRNQ